MMPNDIFNRCETIGEVISSEWISSPSILPERFNPVILPVSEEEEVILHPEILTPDQKVIDTVI